MCKYNNLPDPLKYTYLLHFPLVESRVAILLGRGMFPRVFGDEFGEDFSDKFGDDFSESLNLVMHLVNNLAMNLVIHQNW